MGGGGGGGGAVLGQYFERERIEGASPLQVVRS